MARVTVSARGQIAIPKAIRDQLGITAGTKLDLLVDGTKLVFTISGNWRSLYGIAAGTDLLDRYMDDKAREKTMRR